MAVAAQYKIYSPQHLRGWTRGRSEAARGDVVIWPWTGLKRRRPREGGGIHVVAGQILFVWYVRRVSEALFLYATIKVLIPTIIFWIAERTADRKICGQKK